MAIYSVFEKLTPNVEVHSDGSKTLSLREEEIVSMTIEGLTDKEIAARLQIASSTIKSYWIRIRQKTRSTTRIQALMSMKGNGVKKPSELHVRCLQSMLDHACLSILICSADSSVLEAHLEDSKLADYLVGRQLKNLMPTPASWDETLFRVRMNGAPCELACEISHHGERVSLFGDLVPLSYSDKELLLLILTPAMKSRDAQIA